MTKLRATITDAVFDAKRAIDEIARYARDAIEAEQALDEIGAHWVNQRETVAAEAEVLRAAMKPPVRRYRHVR